MLIGHKACQLGKNLSSGSFQFSPTRFPHTESTDFITNLQYFTINPNQSYTIQSGKVLALF